MRWTTAKVVEIQKESPTTKRIYIEFPEEFPLVYKAGQFVVTELPIHEKRTQKWRSYSIANAPDGSQQIELCVVQLEGGKGSTYLCETLVVGDEIKVKKPQGVFTLPEDLTGKSLVFICTGTGIAPFRAMIQNIFKEQKTFEHIHLIFGTRFEEGILYRKELEALSTLHANFTYTVCLSRAEQWEGEKGYVHNIYKDMYKNVEKNRHFYLCGWSNMVDEAIEHLKEMGYPSSQIHAELYG